MMTEDSKQSFMIAQDTEVVQRGALTVGALTVPYFTSNPAPTQWVAVGVVSGARLLVGMGPSQTAAINALAARSQQLQGDVLEAETTFATEWTL